MLEPQRPWKDIRASHKGDIEPQELGRYTHNRVYRRRLVVPLMENLRQSWRHLLLERRPHHQSDHKQVQEKHGRLAYTVRPVAPVPRENGSQSERYCHDELHDEVEIRPEGSTGTEKALH